MTEGLTNYAEKQVERIPTYDSFGDGDEALAWILGRLSDRMSQDDVRKWWTSYSDSLDGFRPEDMWYSDPNRVIKLAASGER